MRGSALQPALGSCSTSSCFTPCRGGIALLPRATLGARLPSRGSRPSCRPTVVCAAAAISISLQPNGDGNHHAVTSHSNSNNGVLLGNAGSNPASSTSRAASSSGSGSSASGAASSSNSGTDANGYSTVAAAVAAQFPAVPMLPMPPVTANLRDVVPYLLGLALQERHLAWRLAAALTCMCIAKLAGISLPLAFKGAVDAMSVAGFTQVAVAAALAALLKYGALDCVRVVAKEMQSPFFAPVSQAVTRRVAYHTFAHVLCLDTRFHLDRRTGRVSRILERGTRSIAVLYRALIFTFLPTGIELTAVGLLLAGRFGPLLAGILAVTFGLYVTWTVLMTQMATDVRKEVNQLDNATSSKAVDALLNYETVTLFNNQHLEVGLYDKHLRDFQSAAYRTERLSAMLNAGQGLILAVGMAAILSAIVSSGTATGGDLVMASGLIVQLWAPLQFLGWFYRELRAALVDMEEFFQILRTRSNIVDGKTPLPSNPIVGDAAFASASAAAATMGTVAAAAAGMAAATAAAPVAAVPSASSSVAAAAATEEGSRGAGGPAGHSGHTGLSVELVDVSFGYSTERQILKGVSILVAPGESVAVVGSSGSGKSTILKLVTRLYDVWEPTTTATVSAAASTATTSGNTSDNSASSSSHNSSSDDVTSLAAAATAAATAGPSERLAAAVGSGKASGVYINGVDIRQLRLSDVRSAIAVVPQDTALNYESILENIRYGRPGASDSEVVDAARMARLHDTVMALPDKYDTVVGERGLKLSGGEKQRVAIARAFLRSPRLLICDEATSALDSATEAAIMESLKELATGRSALFVAHRLSTVRNCDRIVVLRAGAVMEEGSHDELMELGGEYAAMWDLQGAEAAEEDDGSDTDGGMTDTEGEMEMEMALAAVVAGSGAAASNGNGNGSGKGLAAAAPVAERAAAAATVKVTDSMDEVSTYSRRAAAAVVVAAAAGSATAAAVATAAASSA